MDPRLNPYAPGAGTAPPELAGRSEVVEKAAIALDRFAGGLSARGLVLYGLRGVGKTVLLNHIQAEAEAKRHVCVKIEAPEERSLPGLLAPALRASLLRLDRGKAISANVNKAMRALAGFINSVKVTYQDVEVNLDVLPEKGVADSGDLNTDLSDLFAAVGGAALSNRTVVVLCIDELQYVKTDEFAALITALHHANQRKLPITMMAAGLPQLLGSSGRAKSYAERLFEFIHIDKLDAKAAREALVVPARKAHVEFASAAITAILAETQGYPYFLQEWGKHSWDVADRLPIKKADARRATERALAELDASFFRARFDRLTIAEKRYLRAMAELGPGPHRSGDIAQSLGRKVTNVAPIRGGLIKKGMVYSLAHGDTGFTVPLFDGFVKRTMPAGDEQL